MDMLFQVTVVALLTVLTFKQPLSNFWWGVRQHLFWHTLRNIKQRKWRGW